jgi:hypothetical protein
MLLSLEGIGIMTKSRDLENELQLSSETGLEASEYVENHRERMHRNLLGLALSLVAAGIISGISSTSEARDIRRLITYANHAESRKEYRKVFPDDPIGLEPAEIQRAYAFDQKVPGTSVKLLYYMIRGDNPKRSALPSQSDVLFGDRPVQFFGWQGETPYSLLVQYVTGKDSRREAPDPDFAGAGQVRQKKALSAMWSAISQLGLEKEYMTPLAESGLVNLPFGHEVILSGYKAIQGSARQKVQQALPSTQPVTPPAKVDPCSQTELEKRLAEVKSGSDEKMADHDDPKDIRADAKKKYDAIQKQCPNAAAYIAGAMKALDDVLKDYVKKEAQRPALSMFDIGGRFLKSPLSAGGTGHLALGFSNQDAAQPLDVSAFLAGGHYDGEDALNTKTPWGGLVFNLAGKDYALRLTGIGLGISQSSSFSSGPVTQGPTTTDVVDQTTGNVTGTQTSTATQTEEGTRSTEGYRNQQWLGAGELSLNLHNDFILNVGFGFGRYATHDKTTSSINDQTHTEDDSEDQGPPRTSVHTEVDTETDVDTTTISDVVTNAVLAYFGLAKRSGRMTFGGDIAVSYINAETKGSVDTTINTTVGDAVSDINIDGLPPQQVTAPGQDLPESRTHDDIEVDDQYQFNIPIRAKVRYDSKKMVYRLELGPVLGGDNDGFRWGSMPMAGNATALFNNWGMTLGANAVFADDKFSLSGVFASDGSDFARVVGYTDMLNQLHIMGLVPEPLRQEYAQNLYDALVETRKGFTADIGFSVNSEESFSFNAALAYVEQFRKMGPLGAGIGGRTDKKHLRGVGYLGLTEGVNLRLEAYTEKDDVAGKQAWGLGAALVWHEKK